MNLSDFHAGPMCGNKALQPVAVRREIIVPITMNKLLIFVVDLTACHLLDAEPRKVAEMKEDIADALGVTAEGEKMEVIFAGYDGPKRQAINEDAELNAFFAKFDITNDAGEFENDSETKSELPAVQEKRRQEELAYQEQMGMTRQQLSDLRLGSVITKIQMTKYIRQLGQAKKKIIDLEVGNFEAALLVSTLQDNIAALTKTHQELQEEHTEVVASIPGQVELAVMKAVHQIQNELEAEKEAALKEQGVQMVKEHHEKMKAEISEVQKKSRKLVNKVESERDEAREMLQKTTARCEQAEQETQAIKKELKAKTEELDELQKMASASRDESANRMATEGREMREKLEGLQGQYESCRSQLLACIQLLEENQIPLPGRMIKEDEKMFKWRVPKVSLKLENYQRDHAIQSPEFTLWGLNGLQVELYPNGIQGSYPGWAALKLRVPRLHAVEGKTNRVQLNWKVRIGSAVLGPRRDDFCEDYWWCCKGTVMWPNFVKQETLKKEVEDDALGVVVEFLEASVQLVDAMDKSPPKAKTGANGLKLLPELKHLKGDRQVVISWKGKIVEDKTLMEYVVNYLSNALKPSVFPQKNIGSIMWDANAGFCSPSERIFSPSKLSGEFDPFGCSPSPTNRKMAKLGLCRVEDEEDGLRSCSPLKSSRCATPVGKARSLCSSPMNKHRLNSHFPGATKRGMK